MSAAPMQGWLRKQGGSIKTWKKRHCVIKDGALHYSKAPGDRPLGQMGLKGSLIQNHKDPKRKNCFEIGTETRLYLLVADTDKEKTEWVTALKAEQARIEGRGSDSSSPSKTNSVKSDGSSSSLDTPAPKKEKVDQDSFEPMTVIGQGSFGQVLQVKKKGTDNIYAMKVLNKKNIMERNEAEHAKTEKNVLQKLVHPFLVNLHYSFQTSDKLYFVMDYVNGGELFYHLQKSRKFDEERTRFYCAEICCGIEYLHDSGVLYRDLKPENLLLTGDGHICMTDFGIAKEGLHTKDDRTATFCGTPEYLAPEVLEGRGYGKGVDWWSFGTLMYEMLTGLPPFYSQDVQQMYSKIMSAKVKYPDSISADAKDLLQQLLIRDPDTRLSDPKKIKDHPFFSCIDWDKLVAKEVDPPFIPPVKDASDTGMVDPEFTSIDVKTALGDEQGGGEAQPNFDGFTFVAESALAEGEE
jgi:serine/threonine protein kinase